ncbi:phospholipid-transporting ATPase 1-like protein,putative [Trypanosoma brucei gambiense DAL972]|uniref:Phospholipid-transporting ATPase n=1 Tax=Trypanosoma brucei gambiense (strain MHOM/CI/86/DAL972) TaxID=679716 RepID=D0A6F9_TRYB9|nr:phospholipid-transporting ATPase 1-like protein,putative [Trypanosoma brucei gambiense DAL972]CBH17260.1 phospholipid-transporting ATPase 1-like protein,putative [Trypanosoma brucei gambiense DAL972]|eukprot:XP_011779524.1 phospholipid-transporting ATPase 1-like protein,putative [Trypanosoma brucei gambiense DAL972]
MAEDAAPDTSHQSSNTSDEGGAKSEVIVHMNNREANEEYGYPNNFIKTSHYTALSFLPLGLIAQFMRVSNFYFLVCMCLTLIPGLSPVNPVTAILPLLFVIGVSLAKEGVEEFRRHTADRLANSVEVDVLINGVMQRVPSRDIRVGDIVRVSNGEEVRADLLCLSTSDEEDQVYIDMCNLDGETSLKNRKPHEHTASLRTPEQLQEVQVKIVTTQPDAELHSWSGCIESNGEAFAVDIGNFLCRGSVLRKTDWVWGVVVYAGVDTKMFRNLKGHPMKMSDLDRRLNVMIVTLLLFKCVVLATLAFLLVWWNRSNKEHIWYLHWYMNQYGSTVLLLRSFVTIFLLLSYFIPISLFVTIEVCKVIQAYWMVADGKMTDVVNGRLCRCRPNTSNLNEQLAMVRFIFTDKTGTLTENVMKFKQGDFQGFCLDSACGTKPTDLLDRCNPAREAAYEYFLSIALCNTVQPTEDPNAEGGISYDGTSPDEVALVSMAAEHGFRLKKRTTREMVLDIEGVEHEYRILATLEFTPERKMMSIIVRDNVSHHIVLFTKGADSSLLPRTCTNRQAQNYVQKLRGTLQDMSVCGLRTLVIGRRFLLPEEYKNWEDSYKTASRTLIDRSAALDDVCMRIEGDLWPVGATAIEDKLQQEVPETISFFLEAGVVIWMLTGDKRETAVTVAATAKLCDPQKDFIIHIDIGSFDPKSAEAIRKVDSDLSKVRRTLESGGENGSKCTIVIDGLALGVAMSEHFLTFLELSMRVNSAVCCRLTPLQKAEVVRMFQGSTGLTAIAIGDGANDVSMIQEGRVGVGIIGLEGSQAALSADYAIPRFRHLRRLCAVHGRYSLVRNSGCIMISFYKNAVLGMMMILFCFHSAFSGGTLFDGWLLTFFNILLTSIPPFFLGVFDKDLPEDALLRRPHLFTQLSHGLYFDVMTTVRWFGEALIHGTLIFYLFYLTIRNLDWSTHNISMIELGTMQIFIVVLVVLVRCGLAVRCWRSLQLLGLLASLAITLALTLTYSSFKSVGGSSIYWQMFDLALGPKFWLYMLLVLGSLIMINLSVLYFQKRRYPTLRDTADEENRVMCRGSLLDENVSQGDKAGYVTFGVESSQSSDREDKSIDIQDMRRREIEVGDTLHG